MNRDELKSLVGRTVGLLLVGDNHLLITATYAGKNYLPNLKISSYVGRIPNEGHEFIDQILYYNQKIDDFVPFNSINSIVITDEDLKFRRRGIPTNGNILGVISKPDSEKHAQLMKMLIENDSWEIPFAERRIKQ